jgi:hypothetical protein
MYNPARFCNTLVIASLEKCTEEIPGVIGGPIEEASLYRDGKCYVTFLI